MAVGGCAGCAAVCGDWPARAQPADHPRVSGCGAGRRHLQPLLLAGGLFLLFALLVQAMSVTATYVGEKVGWTATNWLRADLALHAMRLDMSFHNNKTPGEMIERIDGDVMDLAMFFSQLVIQVFGNLVLLICILVVVSLEDWRIGLALVIFSGIALFSMNKLRDIAVPHWKTAREKHADLYGYLEEQLSGTEDIRSSGATDYVMRGLYVKGRQVQQAEGKAGVKGMTVWQAFSFWNVMGRILAFVGGYLLFTNGMVTIGTVYMIVYYTDTIFGPLRFLTQEMELFQKAAGSILRLRELQSTQNKLADAGGHTLRGGPLAVAFENVTFGYNEKDIVLKNVSFELQPGQVLGLLGRTGSGKTTIARLLFRLYDVNEGSVVLGDSHSESDSLSTWERAGVREKGEGAGDRVARPARHQARRHSESHRHGDAGCSTVPRHGATEPDAV